MKNIFPATYLILFFGSATILVIAFALFFTYSMLEMVIKEII